MIALSAERGLADTGPMRAVTRALAVIGGCALVTALIIRLRVGDTSGALFTLTTPAPFYAVGLFVVLRMPDRPITFWFIAVGAGFITEVCLGGAVLPLLGSAPWLWILDVVRAWIGTLTVATGVGLIGLFPNGAIRGRVERLVIGVTFAVAIALPLLVLLSNRYAPQGMYPNDAEPYAHSPLYQPALDQLGPIATRAYQLFTVAAVAGGVLLYRRYRRATPDERRQIRWLLFGMAGGVSVQAVIGAILWFVTPPLWAQSAIDVLQPAVSLLTLGALLVALSHQGVFGIDRPDRRAVVFRTLYLLIGAGCLATVTLIGLFAATLVPPAATVLVTAVVALLVLPERSRLERLADRWVFGARLDGYDVLVRFGAALSTSPGPADLLPRLARAVRQSLDLRWARVVLADTPAIVRLPAAGVDGLEADDVAEPALTVPLIHAGAVVGRIECGPRRDGLLLDEDRRLLEQFAGPAATTVHNLQLTAELSERLKVIRRQAAELTASRARVAQAQDAERQRIQRDLHDGVQQDLVAASAKLALVREQLRRGDQRSDESLAELHEDLSRLLVQVREFAHAIHPPVLVDQGLLEAIEAQASRLPLEVVIEADPALRGVRYPARIESAAWYVVAEALTNAVKHADARRVTVALSQPDGRLAVEVRDDGRGFDPAEARGLGLTGLADRMAIVDGTLRMDSAPGHGTALHADIPLQAAEATDG